MSGQQSHRDNPRDNPWSHSVVVSKIPAAGTQVSFTASAAERAALAEIAGVRDILEAQASFHLTHVRGGAIQARGHVRGLVGQDCVVTLEPLESRVEEDIDVMFAEPDTAAAATPKVDIGEDEPDPPEIIFNGAIDLGRLATDMLFLGIDPYPRKAGAAFAAENEASDPAEHPFAALKALQPGARKRSKKD